MGNELKITLIRFRPFQATATCNTERRFNLPSLSAMEINFRKPSYLADHFNSALRENCILCLNRVTSKDLLAFFIVNEFVKLKDAACFVVSTTRDRKSEKTCSLLVITTFQADQTAQTCNILPVAVHIIKIGKSFYPVLYNFNVQLPVKVYCAVNIHMLSIHP